jgi:tRNA G46 methylase TrmB
MLSAEKLAAFPRIIIELGMGDGRLLESLAKSDPHSLYIGVELDIEQCNSARSRLALDNTVVINRSFEELIPEFANGAVERFVAVLPDPTSIDERQSEKWKPLYALAYQKLRRGGTFQIVTELTDELLQPVGDSEFGRWKEWLMSTFSSLGFVISGVHEDAPAHYATRCLDQFRGDSERIRLVTLDLEKQ